MRYCIAIDGGGSKTDALLFDERGHILARRVGPGGNATDMGAEEAKRRLFDTLRPLFAAAPAPVTALYGGVAGVIANGDIYSEEIRAAFKPGSVRIDDDGCCLISGTLGHADGGGMVCGTGSSLFVRREGQPLLHIGGKGYLIDTGGSGFELGREAVCMAMRAVDGRCRETVLTALVAEMAGQRVSDLLIPVLHHGGRPYIASFAPAVFRGRALGDWACIEIFERQSALMADLTYPAAAAFEGDFGVVIGGGVAAHFPEYVEAIRRKASPRAKVILQQAPPVYGAAVEALWDAGVAVTEELRRNFLADYETQTVS